MRATKGEKLVIVLFLIGFAIVVIKSAWLSDDAYITFRTVDNFVNGYGLTWNTAERVQAYTHPLWMFLLSALYFFTHEIFFSSLFLSIAISLVAVSVLALRMASSSTTALLGITILTLSKAFVDYSTSCLESPLTHLILVILFLVYVKPEPSPRTLFVLSLLTALATVNRTDIALLFLPLLGYSLVKLRDARGVYAVGAGFIPLILWELFSLFYYGFLFPNTAYAKLNTGLVSGSELVQSGFYYLLNSINLDPLTLLVIAGGMALPFVTRERRYYPIVAGLALYLLYVVRIGGDFMSGRFLAAPLLGAVVILISSDWGALKLKWVAPFALVLLAGLSSPHSPVFTGRDLGPLVDPNGITDERRNYYPSTGLLRVNRHAQFPDHDWAKAGQAARAENPRVVQKGSIGFFGYFAGPQVYVVDLVGLADPLMARLPPTEPNWAIGHFGRTVPEGYIDTLVSGENRIADENLATYYDKLSFVIRGDLFDAGRLVEVWKLNTGAYDRYLDAYAHFRGDAFVQELQLVNPTDSPYAYAYVWNNGGAEAFLLDDASHQGSTYALKWIITTAGVQFEGSHKGQVSSINALSDDQTLNVGVYFSDSADLTSYDIFERRFWFRLASDDQLAIVLPGTEWHNPQAPQGTWVKESIRKVLTDDF